MKKSIRPVKMVLFNLRKLLFLSHHFYAVVAWAVAMSADSVDMAAATHLAVEGTGPVDSAEKPRV
jgi:hypothetical protein